MLFHVRLVHHHRKNLYIFLVGIIAASFLLNILFFDGEITPALLKYFLLILDLKISYWLSNDNFTVIRSAK